MGLRRRVVRKWAERLLPEDEARSLSTWTCAELARALISDRIVETISASSVQRMLASQKLKPWRVHHWLSSKVPRDDRFRETVRNICDLYTRKLGAHERVLSLDEKPSLQPRTRTSPNKPARASNDATLEDLRLALGATHDLGKLGLRRSDAPVIGGHGHKYVARDYLRQSARSSPVPDSPTARRTPRCG